MKFQKILIIQTAFIGDVILATPIIETLHNAFPQSLIDVLVRKGNETLLIAHPKINQILIWNKQRNKYKNLIALIKNIRSGQYDLVVNCQRFAGTGLITALSGAFHTIGFNENPFSFLFTKKVLHQFGNQIHEVDRNLQLLNHIPEISNQLATFRQPKLYPSEEDYQAVRIYKSKPFVCIAPASIWFTKQFPKGQWKSLINQLEFYDNIFLIGGPSDVSLCAEIASSVKSDYVYNLSGKVSLLQSAALMQDAIINFVNDSAPMHLASAVNAPTCAVYCSTVPEFGFGPLTDFSYVIETKENLPCRPCGLHGYQSCPETHFKCATTIVNQQLIQVFEKAWEHYNTVHR